MRVWGVVCHAPAGLDSPPPALSYLAPSKPPTVISYIYLLKGTKGAGCLLPHAVTLKHSFMTPPAFECARA
eukprot:1160524-Pelagomonas_calceolata.AAC.3